MQTWTLELAALRKALSGIESQVSHLLDRVTECNAASLVTAYETRVQTLEEEKLTFEERISTIVNSKPQALRRRT